MIKYLYKMNPEQDKKSLFSSLITFKLKGIQQ